MAKTVYEPASPEVFEMVKKVINQFPQQFLHINVQDLHLTFKNAPKSKWRAQTRLLRGLWETVTQKKLGICFWKEDWVNCGDAQRAYVVYHELMHINYDDEKGKYSLRQHDVQDFREMIQDLGVIGEKAETFFAPILNNPQQ